MFKHFILTRFNIKFDGIAGFDKKNQFVQTEEWLDERFFLFEKYCLPSLQRQSNKNFIWFVMFSSDTPERYLDRIKTYELICPLFKPLFLDNGDYTAIKEAFNKEMCKFISKDDKYVITTRIDNDDAFHEHMVEEVQKNFIKKQIYFISFIYGLQYDLNQSVLVKMKYHNNHFSTKVEQISNGVDTVLLHDHTYINKDAEVVYIKNKSKPLWLEIIHGGNLMNSLDPTAVPLFSGKILDSFSSKERVTIKKTLLLLCKYYKLQINLLRAKFLKRIGVYDFLRENIRKGKIIE